MFVLKLTGQGGGALRGFKEQRLQLGFYFGLHFELHLDCIWIAFWIAFGWDVPCDTRPTRFPLTFADFSLFWSIGCLRNDAKTPLTIVFQTYQSINNRNNNSSISKHPVFPLIFPIYPVIFRPTMSVIAQTTPGIVTTATTTSHSRHHRLQPNSHS